MLAVRAKIPTQCSHTCTGMQCGQSASEICLLTDAGDFSAFNLWKQHCRVCDCLTVSCKPTVVFIKTLLTS